MAGFLWYCNCKGLTYRKHSRKVRYANLEVVWYESKSKTAIEYPGVDDPALKEGDLYLHFSSGTRTIPQMWLRRRTGSGEEAWSRIYEGERLSHSSEDRILHISRTGRPSWNLVSPWLQVVSTWSIDLAHHGHWILSISIGSVTQIGHMTILYTINPLFPRSIL